MPVKQTTPWTEVTASVSGRVGVPTNSRAASTPSGTIRRTASATSPSSTSTWSTPTADSARALSGRRVVESTVSPRSLASTAAAMPTDEVPPRTRSVWPARTSRPKVRDP